MMRWLMIALTMIGLVMAMLTKSPGILGLALLMALVGMFGTVFSLAAARVSANARPDTSMLPPEALKAIRERRQTAASNAQAQVASGAGPGSAQS